jgi:hypothetical protein
MGLLMPLTRRSDVVCADGLGDEISANRIASLLRGYVSLSATGRGPEVGKKISVRENQPTADRGYILPV